MPDWTRSMIQTYEYFKVDPSTWMNAERLTKITKCSITRDLATDTLCQASIDSTERIPECYVRAYLVTKQDGIVERTPLATVLVQTPSVEFDGRVTSISMDAYSPILELKDSKPPFGYAIKRGMNIMDLAYDLCSENCRAPVVRTTSNETTKTHFIATDDDTWLSFLTDLIANAGYEFDVDEMGRILFKKKQDIAALQPVATYFDDNVSILYPDIDMNQDFYGIPNVVEVVYSSFNGYLYSKAVNDDPSSPISTVSRGRKIVRRFINPDFSGAATQSYLDRYAEQTLRNLSTLECSVRYSHGFTPARAGECVQIFYENAGINGVKVLITSQTIECAPGTKVSEVGMYTQHLYGEE